MAFISAEYRLIPPATGHDILSDIKDAFTFVRRDLDALLDAESAGFHIDPDALAVSGTSAGGLCAYLAAMHVHPKPKALLCMYPMLGDCLVGPSDDRKNLADA